MGVINRLDHRGHGPVAEWQPDNKAEIKTAEQVFNDHMLKGYRMWDISDPERTRSESTALTTFDPEADEILAVPRMQAG